MKEKNGKTQVDGLDLRRCAEASLRGKNSISRQNLTPEEAQRLVHELQVHQIELEIQNEELCRARGELEKLLSEYTDLYDFAPVGYFTLRRDGTIRAVNLAGAALLGIERSGLVGRRLGMYISENYRALFADFLDKVFAEKTKETCEVVLDKKEHPPLFARIDAKAADSALECRAVVVDFSAHRRLEQQLQQTQKMEAVGLLAGGVAHDFNNMLTAIIGYGEAIRDDAPEDDEVLRENIEMVLSAAGRAADLTGRLLAFSRKQVTNLRPVVIDAVIDDISRLIRRVIGADVNYDFRYSEMGLLVMADVGQIEMALVNLVNNARDAMPSGGNLSIYTDEVIFEAGEETAYDLPAPGRYVRISVTDNGSGIDSESMKRLFEPFYTTKDMGKGTGLGLSIVHGIVKKHGGSVRVSSEVGKGTTFEIYLPLIETSSAPVEAEKPVKSAGGSETILLAEDEKLVRTYTGKILERAGYNVITAADGEEAAERLMERDDISLVVTDIVMPKKSGMELFKQAKETRPNVRFLFITGYSPDSLPADGITFMDADFIIKPFKKDDLLLKIREIIDREG